MATILIVDDCPDQLRLTAHLLKSQSQYVCVFAASAEAAVERLRETPVDLVLTDLQLGETDGLQLIDEVRAHFPHIPVILMTASGSEDIAVAALRRGAASYLPKRQLAQRLVADVECMLDLARAAKTLNQLARSRTACTEQYALPNDCSVVPALIQKLLNRFTEFDLCAEHRRMRIGVALEEALVNAIIHGNLEVTSELRGEDDEAYRRLVAERSSAEPYRSRRVKVMAALDANRALIVIRDEGRGFDVAGLPDPTLPENLPRAHGRGLLLIRTFFDAVAHNERGNEIQLTLRKEAAAVAPQATQRALQTSVSS
ncbi:MAG: response regulator [Planctomycetaceae bacterium]|nr:response regulator [Planctomycetaceae bacterium]